MGQTTQTYKPSGTPILSQVSPRHRNPATHLHNLHRTFKATMCTRLKGHCTSPTPQLTSFPVWVRQHILQTTTPTHVLALNVSSRYAHELKVVHRRGSGRRRRRHLTTSKVTPEVHVIRPRPIHCPSSRGVAYKV